MTNLAKLKVSLTKHGSHKVAELLDIYDPSDVLDMTWGIVEGIKIDRAQARKTLAIGSNGKVPRIWWNAKSEGRAAINALVIVSIIFSHWRIIEYMRGGISGRGRGRIERATVGNHKAFTNLSDDFKALQFRKSSSYDEFEFDIRFIIESNTIGKLVLELLRLKLIAAGWLDDGEVLEECIRLRLHKVFGITKNDFRTWTAGTGINLDSIGQEKDNNRTAIKFAFSAGHTPRKIGEVVRSGHGDDVKSRLLHNDLQTKIYWFLRKTHNLDSVGTEQRFDDTRSAIDIVVRVIDEYRFYEIKTSVSLRNCIREALPQLLEYCCWSSQMRANELIIVSPNKPTADAKDYLRHLRENFGLAIYHETVDPESGSLSSRI